jgi:hypothetical protein
MASRLRGTIFALECRRMQTVIRGSGILRCLRLSRKITGMDSARDIRRYSMVDLGRGTDSRRSDQQLKQDLKPKPDSSGCEPTPADGAPVWAFLL